MEKIFGLIGETVSHSFSKSYFDEKFFREGFRDYRYELFPLKNIKEIETLLKETKGLTGLNVTLPYKEKVMKYLNEVDAVAKRAQRTRCRSASSTAGMGLPGNGTTIPRRAR